MATKHRQYEAVFDGKMMEDSARTELQCLQTVWERLTSGNTTKEVKQLAQIVFTGENMATYGTRTIQLLKQQQFNKRNKSICAQKNINKVQNKDDRTKEAYTNANGLQRNVNTSSHMAGTDESSSTSSDEQSDETSSQSSGQQLLSHTESDETCSSDDHEFLTQTREKILKKFRIKHNLQSTSCESFSESSGDESESKKEKRKITSKLKTKRASKNQCKQSSAVLESSETESAGTSSSSTDSDDSSDDEQKSKTQKRKITSKLINKRASKHYHCKHSSAKLENSQTESAGTFSSSIDSDDEKISDSFFEVSLSTESDSELDESMNIQSHEPEEEWSQPEDPLIRLTCDINESRGRVIVYNEHDGHSSADTNAQTSYRSHSNSLPIILDGTTLRTQNCFTEDSQTDTPWSKPGTLTQTRVGELRWPFTSLYVKELRISSDEPECTENQDQHDIEAHPSYKSRIASFSFPGRRNNVMLGRVWSAAWWAVNSNLEDEHVTGTNANATDL